jgi:hypothetical protein
MSSRPARTPDGHLKSRPPTVPNVLTALSAQVAGLVNKLGANVLETALDGPDGRDHLDAFADAVAEIAVVVEMNDPTILDRTGLTSRLVRILPAPTAPQPSNIEPVLS